MTEEAREPEQEPRRLVTTVAGIFAQPGAKEKVKSAGPGNYVTLRREPNNVYDPLAIEVMIDGMKIGYVPRIDNGWLAAAMDNGTTAKAVLELDVTGRITLTIEVDDDRDDDEHERGASL